MMLSTVKGVKLDAAPILGIGDAMTGEDGRLRSPEDLFNPAGWAKLDTLAETLGDERATAFVREVYQAVDRAREEGDFAHLNFVLESWFRTFLFMDQPDISERIFRSHEPIRGKRLTIEDIKRRRAAIGS